MIYMRIRLKNFRCYEDSAFDFGEKGLALLSGVSGRGKSTILMGVQFALFGTGTKVTSHGKTACSVELDFGDLHIVRTKRPNRLVVNDTYEDGVAQELLNERFGDTFDVTGYIAQNALNSFVMMSPIDKLGFLEKFAFKDMDLKDLKARCKVMISASHDSHVSTVSQLDMAKTVLIDMGDVEEVEFPLKCGKGQRDRVIKNEEVKYKNCGVLVKRARNAGKKLEFELSAVKVAQAKIETTERSVTGIEKKMVHLLGENIEYIGDEKLRWRIDELNVVRANREYISLKEQYMTDTSKLRDMKEKEDTETENLLSSIDAELWQEYTKEGLLEDIASLKVCAGDLDEMESLAEEMAKCTVTKEGLKDIRVKLDQNHAELDAKLRIQELLRLQQDIYECPSCSSHLQFDDGKLVETTCTTMEDNHDLDVLEKEISILQTEVRRQEKLISVEEASLARKDELETKLEGIQGDYEEPLQRETINADLEYLRDYRASQKELEKKKTKLVQKIEREEYSTSILLFEKHLKETEAKLDGIPFDQDIQVDLCEDDLRIIVDREEKAKYRKDEIESQTASLTADLEDYESQLEKVRASHIEQFDIIRDENYILEQIEEKESEIEDMEKKRTEHAQILEEVEIWKNAEISRNNRKTWVERDRDLTKEEREVRSRNAACTMMKEKIAEAESAAMLDVIDSINVHAQLYLDCFFPENPLYVTLLPYKTTKKTTKPQINMAVKYKGVDCDLQTLSGGELSRVVLAFTLALAEMFNTPLLMLDECTSSLDEEMTETVIEGIRENFSGKLVLVIAHQQQQGVFDCVVNLS
jgi:exonuclease SbcC